MDRAGNVWGHCGQNRSRGLGHSGVTWEREVQAWLEALSTREGSLVSFQGPQKPGRKEQALRMMALSFLEWAPPRKTFHRRGALHGHTHVHRHMPRIRAHMHVHIGTHSAHRAHTHAYRNTSTFTRASTQGHTYIHTCVGSHTYAFPHAYSYFWCHKVPGGDRQGCKGLRGRGPQA